MNYVITIGFKHDKSTKLENFLCGKNLLLIDIHKVSSVSAQKLRCPSSARNLPSSARSAREISARTYHYKIAYSKIQIIGGKVYLR